MKKAKEREIKIYRGKDKEREKEKEGKRTKKAMRKKVREK